MATMSLLKALDLFLQLILLVLAVCGVQSRASRRFQPHNPPSYLTPEFFNEDTVGQLIGKVTHMDLSGHNITNISPDTFCRFVALVSIDISSNDLESIRPDLFMCNKKLKKIILALNPQLHAVLNKTFLDSDSLEYLDISYCNFTVANARMFKLLPNLEKMDARGNPVCGGLRTEMANARPRVQYSNCGHSSETGFPRETGPPSSGGQSPAISTSRGPQPTSTSRVTEYSILSKFTPTQRSGADSTESHTGISDMTIVTIMLTILSILVIANTVVGIIMIRRQSQDKCCCCKLTQGDLNESSTTLQNSSLLVPNGNDLRKRISSGV